MYIFPNFNKCRKSQNLQHYTSYLFVDFQSKKLYENKIQLKMLTSKLFYFYAYSSSVLTQL